MENVDVTALGTTLLGLITRWGLDVVGAVVVLLVGRLAAKWAQRLVGKALAKGGADETLIPFLSGIAYWAVTGMVVVAVLGMVGIQTASLVAMLGAAGLAVGLALQGTLSNFAAGVMLLIFRPFKVGDFVTAGGESGSVKAIGLFSTTMATGDNVQILLPNQAIWGDTIRNFAAYDTRRIDMVVGISYDDDIDTAINTVTSLLEADSRVLKDPEPLVAVLELGDSAVNLVVRPWCSRTDYWKLKLDLTKAIKEQIEAAGCSFPYPQHDVHLLREPGVGSEGQ
jgi:small conductance mechanosensitive channel